MAMEKKGSAPIISKTKDVSDEKQQEQKGIIKCPKCNGVYLAGRNSCPHCS